MRGNVPTTIIVRLNIWGLVIKGNCVTDQSGMFEKCVTNQLHKMLRKYPIDGLFDDITEILFIFKHAFKKFLDDFCMKNLSLKYPCHPSHFVGDP